MNQKLIMKLPNIEKLVSSISNSILNVNYSYKIDRGCIFVRLIETDSLAYPLIIGHIWRIFFLINTLYDYYRWKIWIKIIIHQTIWDGIRAKNWFCILEFQFFFLIYWKKNEKKRKAAMPRSLNPYHKLYKSTS